jgi:hypothetical protein
MAREADVDLACQCDRVAKRDVVLNEAAADCRFAAAPIRNCTKYREIQMFHEAESWVENIENCYF